MYTSLLGTSCIRFAATLVHQGRHYAQGRGFAGTIGAQQGEKVPFPDFQIDSLQGPEAIAVAFLQPFDFECKGHKPYRFRNLPGKPGKKVESYWIVGKDGISRPGITT